MKETDDNPEQQLEVKLHRNCSKCVFLCEKASRVGDSTDLEKSSGNPEEGFGLAVLVESGKSELCGSEWLKGSRSAKIKSCDRKSGMLVEFGFEEFINENEVSKKSKFYRTAGAKVIRQVRSLFFLRVLLA